MHAHVRTIAHAESGVSDWLTLMWECNKIESDFFGRPVNEQWWAGGESEEYEHARVIHRTDKTVSVVGKDEHGDRVIREAAKALGLRVNDVTTMHQP